MPSKIHEYSIDILKGKVPGLQTIGFKKALKQMNGFLSEYP